MTFFCDKQHYETCFFHSFAFFLLTCRSDGEFLFEDWRTLAQPAKRITSYLKALQKEGVLNQDDFTGTSLRVGSVNWLVNHPGISLVQAWGWSFQSIVNIFSYLICINLTISIAGRTLSGWTMLRNGAFGPTLVFIESLSEL